MKTSAKYRRAVRGDIFALSGILLSVAACGSTESPQARQSKINVEIVGTAECIGESVRQLNVTGIGIARMPRWSGGIGTMEVGPIENGRYAETAEILKSVGCVKSYGPKTCSTPYSNLNEC